MANTFYEYDFLNGVLPYTNLSAEVHAFFDYLKNPETILESGEVLDRALKLSATENSIGFDLVESRLNPLMKSFMRKVFMRGLCAAIDDHNERSLTGKSADVHIATCVMAGRTMVTLTEPDTTASAQLTFIAEESNPANIGFQSYNGTYEDLEKLVDSAGALFKDMKKAHRVMAPDQVFMAGAFPVGERPRRRRPATRILTTEA